MALFGQEIYRLVKLGLTELNESQQTGKTPNNPLSETHFFSAWVTKALKSHRFERCVVVSLTAWQRQARTQGVNAGLKQQFLAIERTYRTILDHQDLCQQVTNNQLEQLLTQLETADWSVITDLAVGRKLTVKSTGQSSLVICNTQIDSVFDATGQLTKPLSLYVRGDSQGLIDYCHQHQLLLHKMTDYKSAVKYHGQYIVYPLNNGKDLPCFVSEVL